MKYLIFFLLSFSLPAFAQEPKGVTPIPYSALATPHSTRAVVVGISDYQSAQIPDLQYADKDAEALADWLKSPAGGSVPADNIRLLTNAQATTGKLATAFDGLVESCREGDLAIIYFSGHGDVERKTISQPGFLLCYDAPPQIYMSGGTFSLAFLQEVVSTLSLQNKTRVVVIADACHGGKLAGSQIGGAQITGSALARQFANEVKILSCQPNEFSLEGAQWGGGRGLFSFHLLEGLTGLADQDSDDTVNLFEIGRFLEDKVPGEAAPQSQFPLCIGDRQFALARVDAGALDTLRQKKAAQPLTFQPTGSKGIVEEILARCDSLTRAQYAAFEAALEQKNLLDGSPAANELYAQLIQVDQLKPLYSLLRRNFAAALIDEVQQALNALMNNDPYEADNWKYNPARYFQFPDYLQRAMELLGEQHYMYRSLMAKKRFFEGYKLAKNTLEREKQPAVRDSLKAAAKAKYLESLAIEPDAAYPCYAVGSLYFYNAPIQTDSVLVWMQKAVDRSPSWLLPYLDAAEEMNNVAFDLPGAERWLLKAKTYHPESYLLLIRLAWLYQWKNDPEASNAICRELIARRPDLAEAWGTLSITQLRIQNEYAEAGRSALEALKLSPNYIHGHASYKTSLVQINPDSAVHYCLNFWRKDPLNPGSSWDILDMTEALIKLQRLKEAEEWLDTLRREGFDNLWFRLMQGRIRLLQGRLAEAETEFQKALDMDIMHGEFQILTFALLGEVKDRQHRPLEADTFFKKAIDFPYRWDQNYLKNEAYFLYGRYLVHQNRPAEAQVQFDNALNISPKTWHYPLGMALLTAKNGRKTETLDWLEKALDRYCFDETGISEEPLFSKIRKTKRFKALMTKHFPPGWAER